MACYHPLRFTFQYVSINTWTRLFYVFLNSNFTFQYVSINTAATASVFVFVTSLHSNMFLLILDLE